MNMRTIIAVLLLLVMTACSAYRREFDANPPFAPHSVRSFDVEIAWQAKRKDHEILVAGIVANHRIGYLRDLELTVRLLDDKGKVLAGETITDFPTYLPSRKSEPFSLGLRFPVDRTPARLRFGYTYRLVEEPPAFRGGDSGEVPRFGTFDAPL
ncbi:MAG: hypothetical protein GJT30_06590 [Geobacter sp.]|nr:hypothetical protein [Geobacter sp.]